MKFTKMHGAGNDYVYVNCFEEAVAEPAALAVEISNRNFGIGSDGLVLIMPSTVADVRMRMFNADGSEAEMCGNGIRCVAKYTYDHRLVRRKRMNIETGAGVLTVDLLTNAADLVERVQVNLGAPRLLRGDIPMTGDPGKKALNIEIEVLERTFRATCVSMGNPHCVIFVDNLAAFPVSEFGRHIERHPFFPNRTNVEFVRVMSRTEVKQRTWERGAGETLACGTGAAAVTVAGVLNGLTDRKIVNHLRGGDLEMEWREAGDVLMTGPAVEVFNGVYIPR